MGWVFHLAGPCFFSDGFAIRAGIVWRDILKHGMGHGKDGAGKFGLGQKLYNWLRCSLYFMIEAGSVRSAWLDTTL